MPKSDNFLRDYYRETQEHMRYRSGIEYRLLQFLLLFYPIIGVAIASLYRSQLDKGIYLLLSVGAAIFILILTVFITIKIYMEHKNYRNIGESTRKVWRYFKLQETGAYLQDDSIVPENLVDTNPNKGYGSGKGHIYTLFIVWIMALAMIGLTLVLGIFAPDPQVSEVLSYVNSQFDICCV